MSSIAYVTDRNMIEFHRLNGNNRLNFWRPSNSIRFADFQEGDLLFFLAKGTERNKEKGIIGYGSYDHGLRMSPNQAWNRFDTMNGYHSKEEFFSAINKVSKKQGLPKSIGCLCLKDVVYFQEPLYLSELGVKISNRIQSYTYLDKENDALTLEILEKAKQIGVDMWSISVNEGSSDISVIEQDQIKDVVSKACEFLGMGFYSELQQRKLRTFVRSMKEDNEISQTNARKEINQIEWMKGSKIDCYSFIDNTLTIRIPMMAFTKDIMTYVQYTIGRLHAYRSYLVNLLPSYIKIELMIVLNQTLDESIMALYKINEIEIDHKRDK